MIRVALITLAVSTALPFTAALAQTAGEPGVAPAAPVEVVPSPVSPTAAIIDRKWVNPPNPIIVPAAPVETAPALPPATAPVTSPIVAAPTPVEPASAEPPAAVPVMLPPPVSPPSAAAAPAAPNALPPTPSVRRRTATKSPKSRAPTSVTVVNDREIPATTVTVLSDAQTVIHAGPLAPKAQSTLTLSQFKRCLVTIEAIFEGGSVSDGSSIDVCRVKLIRLTDGPVAKAAGQASPDIQDAKRVASETLASLDPARVDINTASIEELNRLGGRFGRAIIAGRPYASIDDLVSKRVLTRATFSQIKDQITAN